MKTQNDQLRKELIIIQDTLKHYLTKIKHNAKDRNLISQNEDDINKSIDLYKRRIQILNYELKDSFGIDK